MTGSQSPALRTLQQPCREVHMDRTDCSLHSSPNNSPATGVSHPEGSSCPSQTFWWKQLLTNDPSQTAQWRHPIFLTHRNYEIIYDCCYFKVLSLGTICHTAVKKAIPKGVTWQIQSDKAKEFAFWLKPVLDFVVHKALHWCNWSSQCAWPLAQYAPATLAFYSFPNYLFPKDYYTNRILPGTLHPRDSHRWTLFVA